jgi:hypothetical protein
MMKAMFSAMFSTGVVPPGARWALSGLVLVVLSLSTAARGGGGPGGSNPQDTSTNASSPGDEVTSLPMVEEQSGLTFVGSARAIRHLDVAVVGRGRITVMRLGGGTVAVTLTGDYRVELDRAALALGEVSVFFRGGRAFDGGLARLEIGDSDPVFLDPERVPLPIGRIAANLRSQGVLVTLDVASRRHSAHLEAHFGTERVTVLQRME